MKAYLKISHLFLVLTFLFGGCASKIEKLPKVGVQKGEKIYPGSVIKMNIDSRINSESLAFFMNEQKLEYSAGLLQLPKSTTIGKQKLIARFTFNNKEEEMPITLSVYAREKPIRIGAEVINTFEHSTDYYTQGLEFDGDWLYESTGGLGNSLIIRYNPFTGVIDQERKLGKDIFGEGITLVDDQLFHLTWQNGYGTIRNKSNFDSIQSFEYRGSIEGWGLTHDDDFIYKSDGSELIWRLSKTDASEIDYLTIGSQNSYFKNANELELYGDLILSNVYQKDSVMVIDKNTGAIVGVLDLSSLKELIDKDSSFDPLNSVLNGIAYHKERKTFFVTGKNWNKLFELRIDFSPLEIK
jgi:glutamine cyclotransferase